MKGRRAGSVFRGPSQVWRTSQAAGSQPGLSAALSALEAPAAAAGGRGPRGGGRGADRTAPPAMAPLKEPRLRFENVV